MIVLVRSVTRKGIIIKKWKNSTKGLSITVVLTVCLSLLNWFIVSDHGNVKIQRVHLTGDDGFDYSGLVYTPKQAKIDITRLHGMPSGMTVGIAGSIYLYRKTGSVWSGAFLMGIVCSLAAVLYGTYSIPFAG